ncbi:MAG: universal stress protein, partial [Bacteroidota bacterium]
MKKILVPTDFSDLAGYAGEVAAELAPLFNAEVHFFHRVHMPPNWNKMTDLEQLDFPEIQARIRSVKHRFTELKKDLEPARVGITTSFGGGHLIENIASYIDHEGVQMIIMGS